MSVTITRAEKQKILDYMWHQFKEHERLGLKDKAKEWKDKFYQFKQWNTLNYTDYKIVG
jgi:hypothetical protein